MVRRYQRKSSKASWNPETLLLAMDMVRSGAMTTRAASIQFGVPRGTLRDRLRKNVTSGQRPHLGRKYALGSDFERELRDFVVELQRNSLSVDTVTLRKLAFDIAEKNGLKHPFSAKAKRAGKDWCQGFLRRHPELNLRRPDSVTMAKMMGLSEAKMRQCLALLMKTYAENAVTPDWLESEGVRQADGVTFSDQPEASSLCQSESLSTSFTFCALTIKQEPIEEEDSASDALHLLADNAVAVSSARDMKLECTSGV
ncbi:uncharacterized protein LOC144138711 [Haemaphysalis longicornis]